jgi:hypothetical protein
MNSYNTPFPTFSPFAISAWSIIVIIEIIGLWKIFIKAGKPGWASIIPIYNVIVLLEIIGKPLWWFLLLLIPCANIVFLVIIINRLSKSFGQGVGFTLGLIFLGFIFYPLLGFGDYTYLGPGGTPIVFGAGDYQKPFDAN